MTVILDLRHTLRALRRTPAIVAIAVLSIALGVGANTVVFSWMDNLVLHPFPGLRDPDRIVGIETAFPASDAGPTSFPVFLEWRDASRSFDGMAAWTLSRVSARNDAGTSSRPLIAMLTGGDYFHVLGGRAHIGRALGQDDERTRALVAVLGYEAWRREFGEDSAIVGRTIHLNGQAFSIIGVAAPRFVGTYVGVVPDLFVPVTLQPLLTGINQLDDRSARAFQIVARLKPGITLASAQRELDALARRLSASHGDRPMLGADVVEARMRYLGGLVSPLFAATLVVTAILLLVACANVAGLLLVRATARANELSLRLAIGASRADLWRLALLESGVLALAGSAVGVVLAYLCRDVLSTFIPTAAYPITLPIDLNARVLLFAMAAALGTSVLCALVPAVRAIRTPAASALKDTSRTLAPAASRLRLGIVASQLAFSVVCLITGGLFIRALRTASTLDLGFTDAERVLLVNTDLSPARIAEPARATAIRELLRRVREIPAVGHASAATFVPLGFSGRRVSTVRIDGYTAAPEEDMSVIHSRVASDYAATMGIQLVAGRDLSERDVASSERVAVVNQAFVKRWLGPSPIGRRIDTGGGWATVVGVLRDGKYASIVERPQPVAYSAMEQDAQPTFTLHVRTAGDARRVVERVRGALRATHVDLLALQPRSLAEHVSASTFVARVGASVLSAFGVLALVLALVGLYAAIAYAVTLRARELGIRRALGAGGAHIVGVVLQPALRIVAIGGGIGMVLSVVMGQLLRARLPQLAAVDASDPFVFVSGLGLLVVAGVISSWIPARRALRVQPASALRDSGV